MNKIQIRNATLLANELLKTHGVHFEALYIALADGEIAAVFERSDCSEKEKSTKIDFFIESSNIDLED